MTLNMKHNIHFIWWMNFKTSLQFYRKNEDSLHLLLLLPMESATICASYASEALNVRKCEWCFVLLGSWNFSLKDFNRSEQTNAFNIEFLQSVTNVNIKQNVLEFYKQFQHKPFLNHLVFRKASKLGQYVPHNLTASHLIEKVVLRS